jgi:hypothetical protein
MQNVADALGARITEKIKKISFGAPARAKRRLRSTTEAGRDDDAVPARRARSVD